MSNFNTVFKDEVARLARKEIKAQLEPLATTNRNLKKEISTLRQRITTLEKIAERSKKPSKRPSAPDEDQAPIRYSHKGLVAMRQKFGISQTEMGMLLGVSYQTVHHWESKHSIPRKSQLHKIAELRGKGKKEIKKTLEELAVKQA